MAVQVPEDLRPAQMGMIALGRVIIGHVGATIVDLTQRGHIHVREDGDDWTMQATPGDGPLNRYETKLTRGFAAPVVLWRDTDAIRTVLDATRRAIVRDAKRHGWMHRWPRHGLTERGEKLRRPIRHFHYDLRETERSDELFPYLVLFGIGRDDERTLWRFHSAFVELGRELPGWAPPPEPEHDWTIDTMNHDQWGGMPRGTRPD